MEATREVLALRQRVRDLEEQEITLELAQYVRLHRSPITTQDCDDFI